MMYKDGCFAKHPHFALNTEMRWCALQAGNIYIRHHTSDAQLTVQELRNMIGGEGHKSTLVQCSRAKARPLNVLHHPSIDFKQCFLQTKFKA